MRTYINVSMLKEGLLLELKFVDRNHGDSLSFFCEIKGWVNGSFAPKGHGSFEAVAAIKFFKIWDLPCIGLLKVQNSSDNL